MPARRKTALIKIFSLFAVINLPLSSFALPGDVFNVKQYGAVPDDSLFDTDALSAAFQAAQSANGGTVYFPPGLYIIGHIDHLTLSRVNVKGAGRDLSVIRSNGAAGYLLTFENTRDLQISDIAFDKNGCLHYGGIRFYSCSLVTIQSTRFFDSDTGARAAMAPSDITDIYPYVFGRGYKQSEDILIENNLIEDLQLEVDYCKRVIIRNNTIVRPVSTAGIGIFSLQYGAYSGLDTCGDDIVISGNTITDIKMSFTAIAVHLDPPVHTDRTPVTGVVFQNIRITDNTIIMDQPNVRNGYAIKLGQTDNSQATSTIIYDNIRIERNKIYCAPVSELKGSQFIQLMTSRPFSGGPDFLFTNTTVKDNSLYYDGTREFVRIYGKGADCIEENNQIFPYSNQNPTAAFFSGGGKNIQKAVWNLTDQPAQAGIKIFDSRGKLAYQSSNFEQNQCCRPWEWGLKQNRMPNGIYYLLAEENYCGKTILSHQTKLTVIR